MLCSGVAIREIHQHLHALSLRVSCLADYIRVTSSSGAYLAVRNVLGSNRGLQLNHYSVQLEFKLSCAVPEGEISGLRDKF